MNQKEQEYYNRLIQILKKDPNMSDKEIENNLHFTMVKNQLLLFYADLKGNKRQKPSIVAYAIDLNETMPSQIGHITFTIEDKKKIFLDQIYIGIDCRKLGLGTALLQHFENVCLKYFGNKTQITGVVMPDEIEDMKNVCDFYKKNGYTLTQSPNKFPQIEKTLKKKFSLFKNNENAEENIFSR